jgi:hypothetical protein
MKLSHVAPRCTTSSIQDRVTRVLRPRLLARPPLRVRVRVKLESRRVWPLPAGGVRKWNGVWRRRKRGARTCVVPFLVVVDALCTSEPERCKLDVRQRVDCLYRRRETPAAGPCVEVAQTAVHPGWRARLHGDLPAHTSDNHHMTRQARRRRMTQPAEVASQ